MHINMTNHDFVMTLSPVAPTPIIISVPHDGLPSYEHEDIFTKRTSGIHGRDLHTWPIAKDIARQTPVHIVRGMLHRSFVDYNRSDTDDDEPAYDDPSLKHYYDAYHEALAGTIGEVVFQFGEEQVLLIDLHGFAHQPSYGTYDLIYGTRYRTTVRCDIDRESAAVLRMHGYSVFVPGESPLQDDAPDRYNGRFIVQHYAAEFGINAIQIEIASHYRRRETAAAGKQLATYLAQAFGHSCTAHI